jgi:hypothetical protein
MSGTLTARWLRKAQSCVNEDPAFRKLGSVDTTWAIKVGASAYLISFRGFSCHGVRKIAARDLRDADFLVEMTSEAWSQFIDGRRSGSGPTLTELDTVEGVVRTDNPRKKLDFLRYHLSVQAFLDAGARAA